jgi:hypothetical protein
MAQTFERPCMNGRSATRASFAREPRSRRVPAHPDTRMIFLAEHNGGVTKINGKTFEPPLPPGADADDLAETLWMRKVFRT